MASPLPVAKSFLIDKNLVVNQNISISLHPLKVSEKDRSENYSAATIKKNISKVKKKRSKSWQGVSNHLMHAKTVL
jgi:hypothetical protein